ncbi:MAG: hypothetical protein K6A44_07725 [bacterium]|nr:hypothetical protein [bacterium]
MIAPLIGLQTAIAMSHNATMGMLSFGARGIHSMDKAAQMQFAQNVFMYKLTQAQQEYYQKLLDKNIKRSFSIFA